MTALTQRPRQDGPRPAGREVSVGDTFRAYGTLAGMVLVLIALAVARPLFVDPNNLSLIAIDATVLVVLAVGLSVLMAMRGLDLSLAATADLAGYLAARALLDGQGTVVAVALVIAVGAVVGLVNGLLSAYVGLPAIVATLGTNLVLTSIALVVSENGTPQQLFTAPIDLVRPVLVLGSDSWGPVRLLLLVAVLVVAVAWFVTTRTVVGRYVQLVNSSTRAAFLSGIPVRAVFAGGFVACSLLAACGGLLLTARTGLAVPGAAQPFLLDAFTAVYLGATASPRGRVTVLWTVVGALFVAALANGLVLLGLGAPWRYGLNGALILLALGLGVLRRRPTR